MMARMLCAAPAWWGFVRCG